MATTIPSSKGKPGIPQFKLTGEKIITENPPTSTTLTDELIPTWEVKSGNTFTRQDTITMSQEVSIEIADPDGLTIPTYGTGDFIGGQPFNGKTIGGNLEIYYTLNGKNPTRTKAYLYTGPFTLSDNKSGSDNTIVKARSYKNGIWSDVAYLGLIIASDVTSTNTDPIAPDPSV